MKNIKNIVFISFLLFVNVFCVNASCTEEEILALKEEVGNIRITYKHLGPVQTDDYIDYNRFIVTVTDINDNFYITYAVGTEKLVPENKKAVTTLSNGNWNFVIYSSECNIKIDSIKFTIPTFNVYSLDSLCEGIDGNDFSLCGKYYEYQVSYDEFVRRVTNYRNSNNISFEDDLGENSVIRNVLDDVLYFFSKYELYIIIVILILLIIAILVTILQKRKKRGVLK